MRIRRILGGSLAGLFAVAALATCCGDYGARKTITVKTNRDLHAAIVRDGRLYALTDNGEVFSLDAPDATVKSHGRFDLKPGSGFDVAGDRACLAVQNRIYVADLVKQKIVAAQVYDHPITGVGFVGTDRLFVMQDGKVQILETATAKAVATLTLGADKIVVKKALACQAQGDRLYVLAAGEKQSLIVLDWANDRILDEISVGPSNVGFDRRGGHELRVQGDKVFLGYVYYSYGIPIGSIAALDLKSRRLTDLKVAPAKLGGTNLAGGPGNRFCLISDETIFQFDSQGNTLSSAQPKTNGRILTTWNGSVVAAGQGTLEFVPLAAATSRTE